ncbi:hypothetical protein J437_LFUL013579 [Ladona fulva]|uniref:Uncharacterized protein n=1 Tax=Ladona fulva TaxID=123851 RepID=A0A8K0KDH6_LADFU|nr:hypothetical protein J437_LFUL013579 [Ladona fulva]
MVGTVCGSIEQSSIKGQDHGRSPGYLEPDTYQESSSSLGPDNLHRGAIHPPSWGQGEGLTTSCCRICGLCRIINSNSLLTIRSLSGADRRGLHGTGGQGVVLIFLQLPYCSEIPAFNIARGREVLDVAVCSELNHNPLIDSQVLFASEEHLTKQTEVVYSNLSLCVYMGSQYMVMIGFDNQEFDC